MQRMGYPRLAEHRARHWQCHRAVASILVTSVERNELDRDTVDEVFAILLDLVARVDLDFRAFLVATGNLPSARSMVVARWPSPAA
jgi:hemerythrin